ncbi:type II toxin-antitoxin system YafO family toxin [Massilia sp. W12]|uniref:type II toxin-antitoxin system YafO family toxin n=1 Tax=Massilia sp. W12 TaxID=3126507 RepID=UPI0030D1ACCB
MHIVTHLSDRISRQLSTEQIDALIIEFVNYKSGKGSQYFGRDELYNRPASAVDASLRHAHIHPHFLQGLPVTRQNNTEKKWRLQSIPFHRTSDTHLIYCQGIRMQNHYKLLAFLKTGAHDYAKMTSNIGMLADEAELFQRKY